MSEERREAAEFSGSATAGSDGDEIFNTNISNDVVITKVHISADEAARIEIKEEEQDGSGTSEITSYYLSSAGELTVEEDMEDGGLFQVAGYKSIKTVLDTGMGAGNDVYVDLDGKEINA